MTCIVRCLPCLPTCPRALASTWWWPPAAAPGPGHLLEVSPGAADHPAGAGGVGQHLVVATCSSSWTWPAARCRHGRRGSPGRRQRRWPAPGGGHLQQLLYLASCSMSPRAPRIHRPASPALASTWWRPPAAVPGLGQLLEVSPGRRGSPGRRRRRWQAPGDSHLQQLQDLASCSRSARAPRIHRPAPPALASTWWWPLAAAPGPGQLLNVSSALLDHPGGAGQPFLHYKADTRRYQRISLGILRGCWTPAYSVPDGTRVDIQGYLKVSPRKS